MRHKFDIKTPDLLIWKGWIVMSRSEAPFFERLFKRVSKLRPSRVLEVGFGLGVSAALIQHHFRPREHDIVEIDAGIFQDLQKFSKKHRGVRAIRDDFWSFKAKQPYDFIFYDPFEYVANDDGSASDDREYYKDKAERVRALLIPGGTFCWPHFGDVKPPRLPELRRTLYELVRVPPYPLHDGTYTEDAAIVCWTR